MRLGIFGGSFDPVHYGHLLLAECCRQQCRLDEVWFLPAAVPPHKQSKRLTSDVQRAEMLELAVAGNPAFSVCRYEIERGGVNYTVDTLTHFHQEDASRELFFLMGGDMLIDLPRWRESRRVCELAVPVAVHRPGAPVNFEGLRTIVSPERFEQIRACQVEMPTIGLSSTSIRRAVAEGQSLRYQVPPAVATYIETHSLYRAVAD